MEFWASLMLDFFWPLYEFCHLEFNNFEKKYFAVLNSNETTFTWIWSLYWYSSSTTNCIHTCMCLQLLWIFRWAIKVNVTSSLNLQNVELKCFFFRSNLPTFTGWCSTFDFFFLHEMAFWFDFEFLHIRIFNWNITYNFSFVIFHHLLLLAILQSDICVGKKVRGQKTAIFWKKFVKLKSRNMHIFLFTWIWEVFYV